MNDEFLNKIDNTISSYIKKEKLHHAYLIETNYSDKMFIAEKIVDKILSFDNIVNRNELQNNGDLIIIDNNNTPIKTEQIEFIKESFKTKSVMNSKRIYIINGVEYLNMYSANKLLKFLEEPSDDIIAILITENKNNVINTIISRCFLIRIFDGIENINYDPLYLDKLFQFTETVEKNNEKAIAFQNKCYLKEMADRTFLKMFLNDLIKIYDDAIYYKICNKVNIFKENLDVLKMICDNNNIDDLYRKIKAIYECIELLKYNPNTKLLIDKLIILMSGVDINA